MLKKHKKKIIISLLLLPVFVFVVFAAFVSLVIYAVATDDHDAESGPRPVYDRVENDTTEWKTYKTKLLTFSYPPGWTVEECIKNCVDATGLSLEHATTNSHLGITFYSPPDYCSRGNGNLLNSRNLKNITQPYVFLDDGTTITVIEGERIKYPFDDETSVQHELSADFTMGDRCASIFGSDGSEPGVLQEILHTFVINT